MGNSHTSKNQLPKYSWEEVGNNNGIDLFRRKDGLVAERRRITLDHRFNLDHEKEVYKKRENNSKGFVQVYEVDGVEEHNKKKQHFCQCAQSNILNVYSERIQSRLSDLPQMSFAQSLNILWETTQSFQNLYRDFGPFHINGELIGKNVQGKVKVWLNQNWALNHPSHEISIFKTMTNTGVPPQLRNQSEMTNNLLQVIEQKTQRGRFPQPFGQDVYAHSQSFRKLKKYLSSYMDNEYKNYVPQVVRNNSGVFNGNEEAAHIQQVQSTYVAENSSKPVFGERVNSSIVLPNDYRPVQNRNNAPHSTITFNHSRPVEPVRNIESARPTQNFRSVEPRKIEQVRINEQPVQYSRPQPVQLRPIQHKPVQIHQNQPYQSLIQPSHQQNHAPQIHFKSNISPAAEAPRVDPHPVHYNSIPPSQPHSNQFPKFKLVNEPSQYPQHSQINMQRAETRPAVTSSQPISSAPPRSDPNLDQIRSMLKQDIDNMNSHRSHYKIVQGNPQ